MLKVENLKVSYDNKVAIDDVSLTFKKDMVTGLIGPNGAGKSTLIKTCIGLISEYSGNIFYNDKELRKNRFAVKQQAAYAPENAELLPYLSGIEFLNLISGIYNKNIPTEQIDFLIEIFGLQTKKDDIINNYSHGMRQKISVAAALVHNPEFILLDEALNGMDSVSLSKLLNFLNQEQKGKVIIISSHNVEMIHDYCNEVYVINKGKIEGYFNQDKLTSLAGQKNGLLNHYIEIINS